MAGFNGWWNSIQNFLTKFQQPKIPKRQRPGKPPPVAPAPTPVVQSPISIDDKMGMIAEAARTKTLLFMKYNGDWRYTEPYSYRFRGEGRLFYAFCFKDQRINSFKLEKIEDLQLTEMPYAPRWPVEIGMG
jgi:predicted DNA-binding transcriptional regulator YafY